jgi:hypothetical protein
MYKTIKKPLALVISLLCLLALGACSPDADPEESDEVIDQVIITNIPDKVKDQDSFKIYVQLSTSINENDPHAAVSSGKIAGFKNPDGSVTLKLYKDDEYGNKADNEWSGSGKFYVAVTISPQNAPTKEAIDARVRGLSKISTSKIKTIDWNDCTKIPISSKVDAIYDLIIKKDPEITTP